MALVEIIFGNAHRKNGHAEQYQIIDNHIGKIWQWQIEMLQQVPYSEIESKWPHKKHYSWNQLVELVKKVTKTLDYNLDFELENTQDCSNKLHKVYEEIHATHVTPGKIKNQETLNLIYSFHHAVHDTEKTFNPIDYWKIDWGYKAGLCTKEISLHDYYEYPVPQNHITSQWSELGKTPVSYYIDNEPNNQQRINELVKPHLHLRPTFCINSNTKTGDEFPQGFNEWWTSYAKIWYLKHNISDWEIRHDYGCVILATPLSKGSVDWKDEFPLVTKISVI